MNLLSLIKTLLNLQKRVNLKKLPSLGLFYKDDFEISIKKAEIDDIFEYEHNYTKNDIGVVISKLKKIVKSNTIISSGYSFEDIKSIDVIFIFLEIVKFTKGRPVSFKYFDKEIGGEDIVEFSSSYFNYFQIDDYLMNYYDNENKQFVIEGYRFSLPSIGIENCLTNFLIDKSFDRDAMKYNKFEYQFTYFLGDKNRIGFSEIENLIQIFNFDIDEDEKNKINEIVNTFHLLQKYSLRKGSKIIEINSQIDLENIWK